MSSPHFKRFTAKEQELIKVMLRCYGQHGHMTSCDVTSCIPYVNEVDPDLNLHPLVFASPFAVPDKPLMEQVYGRDYVQYTRTYLHMAYLGSVVDPRLAYCAAEK